MRSRLWAARADTHFANKQSESSAKPTLVIFRAFLILCVA